MSSNEVMPPHNEALDAIFFDFDGVLADSLKIKGDAFLSLFENIEQQSRSKIEHHFYRYTGHSRQEKLKHIYEHILCEELTEQKLNALCDQFQERTVNAVIASSDIPGTNTLLNAIPNRILRFVVSGTPEGELQQIISERGISKHFAQVRGTPTAKENNIAQLLKHYELAPDRCLMLGDGLVDKDAADINGIPFRGIVTSGNTSPFPEHTQTFSDLNAVAQNLGFL